MANVPIVVREYNDDMLATKANNASLSPDDVVIATLLLGVWGVLRGRGT